MAATGIVAEDILTRPGPGFDQADFPRPTGSRWLCSGPRRNTGLEQIVAEGLRTVGADVRGQSVLLKPNLVEFARTASINTDPRLVAATVVAMRRLGARRSSSPRGRATGGTPRRSSPPRGSSTRSRTRGRRSSTSTRRPSVGGRCDAVSPASASVAARRRCIEADLVVSMPKLKTHHWVGVTLSLKNSSAACRAASTAGRRTCSTGTGSRTRSSTSPRRSAPALAIVDGIVGMQGDGPIRGSAVKSGVLVVSPDPVAADVTALG